MERLPHPATLDQVRHAEKDDRSDEGNDPTGQ
jgi:hypothetical protein